MLFPLPAGARDRLPYSSESVLDLDSIRENEALIKDRRERVSQAWREAVTSAVNESFPNGSVLEPGCGSGVLQHLSLLCRPQPLEPVKEIAPPNAIVSTLQSLAADVRVSKDSRLYDGVAFINLYDKDDSDISGLLSSAAELLPDKGEILLLMDAMPYFPGLNGVIRSKLDSSEDHVFVLFIGENETLNVGALPRRLAPIINNLYMNAFMAPDTDVSAVNNGSAGAGGEESDDFSSFLKAAMATTMPAVTALSQLTQRYSSLDYFQEFSHITEMTAAINQALCLSESSDNEYEARDAKDFHENFKVFDAYDLWAERISNLAPGDLNFIGHDTVSKLSRSESDVASRVSFKNGILRRGLELRSEDASLAVQEVCIHRLRFKKEA